MPKKLFFKYFFLITYLQAHYLQSYVKIQILQALFQSAQHLYEKEKNPELDPEEPKTCGSGTESPTLLR
jgi:hypothetical protein